jgi:hypothetical protein
VLDLARIDAGPGGAHSGGKPPAQSGIRARRSAKEWFTVVPRDPDWC